MIPNSSPEHFCPYSNLRISAAFRWTRSSSQSPPPTAVNFQGIESGGREIVNRVTGNDSSRPESQGLKTETASQARYGADKYHKKFAESLADTGTNETRIRGRLAAARSEGTHPGVATAGRAARKIQSLGLALRANTIPSNPFSAFPTPTEDKINDNGGIPLRGYEGGFLDGSRRCHERNRRSGPWRHRLLIGCPAGSPLFQAIDRSRSSVRRGLPVSAS